MSLAYSFLVKCESHLTSLKSNFLISYVDVKIKYNIYKVPSTMFSNSINYEVFILFSVYK